MMTDDARLLPAGTAPVDVVPLHELGVVPLPLLPLPLPLLPLPAPRRAQVRRLVALRDRGAAALPLYLHIKAKNEPNIS